MYTSSSAASRQSSLDPDLFWSVSSLHRAIPDLAQHIAYVSATAIKNTHVSPLNEKTPDPETLEHWLDTLAVQLGLECQPIDTRYSEVESMLQHAAPAVLQLPNTSTQETAAFLLLIAYQAEHLIVLGKKGKQHRLPLSQVRHMLVEALETPLIPDIEKTLNAIHINEKRYAQARQGLLAEQLVNTHIQGCYLLRLSPSDDFVKQVRHSHLPRRFAGMMASTLLMQATMLLAWVAMGSIVFSGHVEAYALHAWGLLLITAIFFQLSSLRLKNRLALEFGSLLRKRLLNGIFQLKPKEIRHKGSGSFMGNILDIEQLEAMALSLTFTVLIAMVDVIIATVVLMLGAGGIGHGLLLIAWFIVIVLIGRGYYQRMREWNKHYRFMTADLVERMVGHRTRLAQEKPAHYHEQEDHLLNHYLLLSEKLDRFEALMVSVAGRRGWLVVGLLGLLLFVFNTTATITQLSISMGGLLLAAMALQHITQNFRHLLEAATAWEHIHPLYQTATRERTRKKPQFVSPVELEQRRQQYPILHAQKLHFAYTDKMGKPRNILENCDLIIQAGERFLLEGASGSGKSTLAHLLTGLQQAQQGQLRLFGLSQAVLGEEAWRKHVVIAPQFHENYVFTETFAFNLLMGKRWPPTPEDLLEAETLCRELNLGDLLETMPAGLQQMVGEAGWQLSHGERSRLFIARTLLQQADLIILDESFAALDPETLEVALACVLRRSNALLLIAHP